MKLTDFNELWQEVDKIRKVSAEKIEIGNFTGKGIDTDLSDVYATVEGELIAVLKDGSIRKTIVYICDISNYQEEWRLPRFHVFNCTTLERMKKNDRKYRFRKASRADGQFWTIKVTGGEYTPRVFCGHCVNEYNFIYSSKVTADNFNLKNYIEKPIQHLEPNITDEMDMTTIPSSYTHDWENISKERKEYFKWRCQNQKNCFYNKISHHDLSTSKKYLHTHHINADKSNNHHENLKVLCIECHAKQFLHGHIKQTPQYKDFLQLKKDYARK